MKPNIAFERSALAHCGRIDPKTSMKSSSGTLGGRIQVTFFTDHRFHLSWKRALWLPRPIKCQTHKTHDCISASSNYYAGMHGEHTVHTAGPTSHKEERSHDLQPFVPQGRFKSDVQSAEHLHQEQSAATEPPNALMCSCTSWREGVKRECSFAVMKGPRDTHMCRKSRAHDLPRTSRPIDKALYLLQPSWPSMEQYILKPRFRSR